MIPFLRFAIIHTHKQSGLKVLLAPFETLIDLFKNIR